MSHPAELAHNWLADGAMLALIGGAMWGAIPKVAALIGCFYYCLLIYEWTTNRRKGHAPETNHDGS